MDDLERALLALGRDGVVVYPTETLYGLGALAFSEIALERLAELKGHDRDKPISVLVASRAMLEGIAAAIPDVAERLIAAFWPGALTIAFPAKPGLSPVLTAGGDTIAARISSHPIAQALVERVGRPLTATSANPGGLAPPSEVRAARGYFGSRVDVYVDGGRTAGGPASTVVDCSQGVPKLSREGAIPLAAVERAAGMRLRRE